MEYDRTKVEEAVLALLALFEFEDGRILKHYPYEVMEALHNKGLIGDPRQPGDSLNFTEDGVEYARELARRLFAPLPPE